GAHADRTRPTMPSRRRVHGLRRLGMYKSKSPMASAAADEPSTICQRDADEAANFKGLPIALNKYRFVASGNGSLLLAPTHFSRSGWSRAACLPQPKPNHFH